MVAPFNTRIMAVVAVAALLFAVGVWSVLVRSVPRRSGTGVIKEKSFREARTITRKPVGGRRQDWGEAKEIRVPESDVFIIWLDQPSEEVKFSMPASAGAAFEVGQRVRVRYEVRSIPGIWRRIYVKDMQVISDD